MRLDAAAEWLSTMRRTEQERTLVRIADLRATLRRTHSPDVREAVRKALADCELRLGELDSEITGAMPV
jgi:hypothetical protein